MDKYKKIKLLGSGSFGTAWLVKNHKDEECVIKEISIPALKPKEKESAINEVKVLATLKHKNIVRYKEAFVCKKALCIAMEYADDGDLATKIKQQLGKLFLELKIIDWFVQILIAVKYIHSLNILHRDLKSQNIFLTKYGLVKIGDFGISRVLSSSLEHAQTTIGTPFYLSPEICQQKPYNSKSDMWSLDVLLYECHPKTLTLKFRYNSKSDMWSLGVLLYELCTLRHPFIADDFQNLVVKIIKGCYAPIPGKKILHKTLTSKIRCYGPLLQDLVLILLQVPPDDRPSASQLLKVPSLQLHLKSYLMKVRHKEEPVIFDSGICSCSDDEKACTRHSSREHSREDMSTGLKVQSRRNSFAFEKVNSSSSRRSSEGGYISNSSEANHNESSSSQKSKQEVILNNDKSTRKRSSLDSTVKRRHSMKDEFVKRRSLDSSSASGKQTSTPYKRRSRNGKMDGLPNNITASARNDKIEEKTLKPPVPGPVKSSPNGKKKTENLQKKTPKINFIERNRNLARTPPSVKRTLNTPPVKNRRIKSTPEARQDANKETSNKMKTYALRSRTTSTEPKVTLKAQGTPEATKDKIVPADTKETPKKAKTYALRSRLESTDPKVPLMVTRVRHLSTSIKSASAKPETTSQPSEDGSRSNPKNVEPEIRFPSVRKRAASLMSLADKENVPLKLTKRSVSCEDREQMLRKKRVTKQQLSTAEEISRTVIVEAELDDLPSTVEESDTPLPEVVVDPVCLYKQEADACRMIFKEFHKPKPPPKRRLTDDSKAPVCFDKPLLASKRNNADSEKDKLEIETNSQEVRSQRRSSSNLPQGAHIADSVKAKIAGRLRAASSNHLAKEESENDILKDEMSGDKSLMEVSRAPLHSTMIDEVHQDVFQISPAEKYRNEENTSIRMPPPLVYKKPSHPMKKNPHTATYTILHGHNNNNNENEKPLSDLSATLIRRFGYRKFNVVFELAKRTNVAEQDVQLLQQMNEMLGNEHGGGKHLVDLLRLVDMDRKMRKKKLHKTLTSKIGYILYLIFDVNVL